MSASISGLMILAVFLTGAVMMSRATVFGHVMVSSSTDVAIRLSGQQARTEIDITSAAADGTCLLTLSVSNTGATTMVDPSKMDVIVQFPGGVTPPASLSFVEVSTVLSNEWRVAGITGLFHPGLWNPGETMSIEAKLVLSAGDDGTVTVVGTNGVIDTAPFTTVFPCA